MTRSHQYSMCPDKSKYPFGICCSAHSLIRQGNYCPSEVPTPWISSMVAIPNSLLICLDPKDIHLAIQWEHSPLPTIKDVATWLHEAKVFTILDVSKGLLHIEQDEPSSFLTTFHTPFGRYRWIHMPSGISSALVYWEWFNISANSSPISLHDLLQIETEWAGITASERHLRCS